MTTYNVLMKEDVEVEANNEKEAIEKACEIFKDKEMEGFEPEIEINKIN